MTSLEAANLQTVRAYVAAIQSGATGKELARFFTDDAMQIEYPNRLNPQGGESNLETLLARAAQGAKLLKRQSYAIQSEMANGSQVAVEILWNGTLAVPVSTLPADAVMTAHFAVFFELRDGRIAHQRNYDCFDAW